MTCPETAVIRLKRRDSLDFLHVVTLCLRCAYRLVAREGDQIEVQEAL